MEEEGVCPAGGAIDDNIVLTIRNVNKVRSDPGVSRKPTSGYTEATVFTIRNFAMHTLISSFPL